MDSASKSNGRAVGKSMDPDMEMKVCVDASFTNATYEVNPQSRSLHPSTHQDHPNSFVNHFDEESKQEEGLKPVREEQSLVKNAELTKDPRAVSSNVVESRSPHQETREETRDHPVASTIPPRQELDEASKEDQGIEMQRMKSGSEVDENMVIVTVHE